MLSKILKNQLDNIIIRQQVQFIDYFKRICRSNTLNK